MINNVLDISYENINMHRHERLLGHSFESNSCDPRENAMGILHARILEWVAMPSSRGSFQPRDQTQISQTTGRFFSI